MSAHARFFLHEDFARICPEKWLRFSEFLRLVPYNFTEGDTGEFMLSFVIGY